MPFYKQNVFNRRPQEQPVSNEHAALISAEQTMRLL